MNQYQADSREEEICDGEHRPDGICSQTWDSSENILVAVRILSGHRIVSLCQRTYELPLWEIVTNESGCSNPQ
jgi:hypothetical protein